MSFSFFNRSSVSLVFATCLACSASAEAATVYVTSTGNANEDSLVQSVLFAGGHTATIGTAWHQHDGSQALTNYDVVLVLNNYNWASGFPTVAGQQKLVDYVTGGGGLVTSEWFNWRIAGSGNTSNLLYPISPIEASNYNHATSTSYTKVTPDATINAGLPDTFSFNLTNLGGTESHLTAKSGATVFYSSSNGGGTANSDGLIGWDTGSNGGRVISFSTLAALTELGDANYAKLLNNSVSWASTPVPVPASIWLFGSALAVMARRFIMKQN